MIAPIPVRSGGGASQERLRDEVELVRDVPARLDRKLGHAVALHVRDARRGFVGGTAEPNRRRISALTTARPAEHHLGEMPAVDFLVSPLRRQRGSDVAK